MQHLIEGHKRFLAETFPAKRSQFHLLAEGQRPECLFVTCADSRVVPDLILQTQPGEMFICRNAGNVIPRAGEPAGGVSATIEYGVQVLGVRHLIVCGHSDCGVISALMAPMRSTACPACATGFSMCSRPGSTSTRWSATAANSPATPPWPTPTSSPSWTTSAPTPSSSRPWPKAA